MIPAPERHYTILLHQNLELSDSPACGEDWEAR
jgi:hypothetical protein